MRGVSSTSNQDPSEYCVEVRQGKKGQRNWRAEGPNVAVQTGVPSPGSISRDVSLENAKMGILFHLHLFTLLETLFS